MNLTEVKERLDKDARSELLTVDRRARIQADEARAAAQVEADEARAALEESARAAEAQHRAVFYRFHSVFDALADPSTREIHEPKTTLPIKLGGHAIPGFGEGFLYARLRAKDALGKDDVPLAYAEQFVTEIWFSVEGEEDHKLPREVFGFVEGNGVQASRDLSVPRRLDLATQPEATIEAEVRNIDALCRQASETLELLELSACDPDLNPDIAARLQHPHEALQSATSVV